MSVLQAIELKKYDNSGPDTPASGSVFFRGDELTQKCGEELTIFRRRSIGFIFRSYNLVPILNVYENIVLPAALDGDTADKKFMDRILRIEVGRIVG